MSVSELSITTIKKLELIRFIAQLIVILTVMLVSLINLSLDAEREKLWFALLAGSIGLILPNPKLNEHPRTTI